MGADTKRQNFNITAEQEAELAWLREAIGAPTTKDAVLRAVHVLTVLAREVQQGREIYLHSASGEHVRLLIPELQPAPATEWKYLVARPHPWRREYFVKGRRLRASRVWRDMQGNGLTAAETAENWELPLEAVQEIVRYCESHRELLEMEAAEERRRLQERGIRLEPPPPGR